MSQIYFTTLSEQEMLHLHRTFLKAFADYLVPIQLSEEQFNAKRKREGVIPELCVAAYDKSEMIGFIMTGVGEWNGKPTAYNAGTGVIPAYRNQKLAQRLYAYLLSKLRVAGVEQCLLEVIRENIPALKSYQSLGMTITRSLDSYRSAKTDLLLNVEMPEDVSITKVIRPAWKSYQMW
jgi:ribosomal protein S18 acetylase RimI-like enzyme